MLARKLLQSTAVTGGMTLLSRISGLVRDTVFASLIGAGAGVAADAFYTAFRIPNFFRRIFGEGALSQAFVPVYAEYHAKRTPAEARVFVDHMTGVLALVLFIVTLAGVIAAPLLVTTIAPGFRADPHKYELTVQMLRIVFPYLMFVSLVALAAGVLNTHGRFGAAAFTPVLLNFCLIGAALLLAPRMAEPVVALAWGVFLAGIVQLLFQIPFLRGIGALPRPRLRRHEGVRRVGKLMLPAIFGVSIAQINLLVNTVLASFLVTGSVSWLYYADRLMEFPLGVFGIALATVILPSLSRRHADQSSEEFSHLLDWGLRWVFIITVPATVGLALLAGPILTTLFYRGAFTMLDVQMSANALVAFAIGLSAFVLVKVLATGFYARHDTRTPVRVGVMSLVANIAASLLLVSPLGHVGLATAVTISGFVNAILLYVFLRRQNVYRPQAGWPLFLGRIGVAAACMAAVIVWGAGAPDWWITVGTRVRIGQLVLWISAGGVVYGLALMMLGFRPVHLRMQGGP